MLHRNTIYQHGAIVLLLFGFASIFAFSRPLLGEDHAKADRINPADILTKKLKTPIKCDYKETPLNKVITELAKKVDVKITLDPKGLAEVDVSQDSPITFSVMHEIMLKSTLILILDPLHLMYDVKEDEIVICSESQYDARIVKRSYNLTNADASPTEIEELIAKIRVLAALDAPKGAFKKESIVASKDGKQIVVELPRSVHSELNNIPELRSAEDRTKRIR
jgi:hypothetical protein